MKKLISSITKEIVCILILLLTIFFISNKAQGIDIKEIKRLSGPTRYETAVAISKEGWPNGSKTIILTRGDLFPDALAGAPLAYKYSAPIILVKPQLLEPAIAEEIKRLKVKEVIILGLQAAVSSNVITQLQNQCGISNSNIHRIGGETRYETAALISSNLEPPQNHTAIIAYGENYPDALSAASLASYLKMPILLVTIDTLPIVTQEQLRTKLINQTIIVGDNTVVPDGIASWLKNNGYPSTRLAGATRYETCRSIIDYSIGQGISPQITTVAYGENFPDALSLGPFAAKNKSTILLVRKNSIPEKIKEFISSHKDSVFKVYLAGGTAAISDAVQNEIFNLIK